MAQREEFEKFAIRHLVPFGASLEKNETVGEYVDSSIVACWIAWQEAKAQAIPEGYSLIPTEIINRFPEINMSNYGQDDVDALNSWGVEVVTAATQIKDGE